MALSKEEQQVLAEIERKLAGDDPVLAARLTTFRLPRMSLAPRSPRARLGASLLMLVVVAAVSVFVYVLMPFRGQPAQAPVVSGGSSAPSRPTMSAPSTSSGSARLPGGKTQRDPGSSSALGG